MVLGLWDHLCWHLIWLLSVVTLPYWHPGKWQSPTWLPVPGHVPSLSTTCLPTPNPRPRCHGWEPCLEWRQGLYRAGPLILSASLLRELGRWVCCSWPSWAQRPEILVERQEGTSATHLTLCHCRVVQVSSAWLGASQSSPWESAPSCTTLESPNLKIIPSHTLYYFMFPPDFAQSELEFKSLLRLSLLPLFPLSSLFRESLCYPGGVGKWVYSAIIVLNLSAS